MQNQVDISRLILAFLNRRISDQDMQILQEWVRDSEENRQRFEALTNPSGLKERVSYWPTAGGDKEKAWQILLDRRQNSVPAPVRQLSRLRKYWQIAAAVVIIVVGTVIYFRIAAPSGISPGQETREVPLAGNDVPPGETKAILRLANGSTINLDSMASGSFKEGNMNIVKGDGSISYEGSGSIQNVLYNTLLVPKGGQYRLLLVDGTKVWLNSSSSIRYPTVFTPGKERNVEISGEVYFEVARVLDKDVRTPFVVGTTKGLKVEVLGTYFNINAYDDEQSIATTLLEGKVKVSHSRQGELHSVILNPGEQAVTKSNLELDIKKGINVQQVMAWKNGSFYFSNTDFASVMRQISRWYDVEIVYEGKVPEFKLNGEASRSSTLANLLSMFANTDVKSKIDGKKLIIPEQ